MKVNEVFGIYFSPTNGTEKCVSEVAGVLKKDYQRIDLTKSENRKKDYVFGKEDLVMIGSPVYGGRLPMLEEPLFRNLKGNNTPVVCMVSYGNRDYDDALLELKTNLENQGFLPVAAGAFIAVHSFSDQLGTNRPDVQDLGELKDFGQKIKEKIKGNEDVVELQVKGNPEYKTFNPMPFAPMPNENCSDCKICVEVCPVKAIDPDDVKIVDVKKCIDCYACAKKCPEKARSINLPPFLGIIETLETNFSKNRKEPEIFI